MEENGSEYYFVKNAEGDVTAIIDENGQIKVKYTYDAWGKTITVKDKNGNDVSSTSFYAKAIPFRFRGYVYDYESGLYYLNSRYYDPETGRFINADSYVDTESGSPLSTNMFAYCENNPVMGYDPEGTWDRQDHWDMSEHIKIGNKKSWFSRKHYKTTLNWNYNADDYPFASTEEYSAPFHSRSKSLSIAIQLYNIAMDIKLVRKQAQKFSYKEGNYNTITKLGKSLKYKNKSNKEATKSAQNEFLSRINNKSYSYKKQSKVFLGLSLHTFQDYFSHVIKVKAITNARNSNGNYVKKSNNKLKKITIKENMTDFNHRFNTDIITTKSLEDNTDFLNWRYRQALSITKQVYNLYKKNQFIVRYTTKKGKIKKQILKSAALDSTKKKNNRILKKYGYKGVYDWTVKSRKIIVTLHSDY